jgi:hypothetical protein
LRPNCHSTTKSAVLRSTGANPSSLAVGWIKPEGGLRR